MLVATASARQNAARMIPTIATARQTPAWQQELRHAFRDPRSLLRFLDLPEDLPQLQAGLLRPFPMQVPRHYAEAMRKADPMDPLFLQVWPQAAEAETADGFAADAVGDLDKLRNGGIIHKYRGRALVMTTGACAVNCRYCFRRHFPYQDHLASRSHWQATLDTIASDPSIQEVILSGGDPLSLSDDKLSELVDGLESILHVRRLRIHTRQPVVLPQRVDSQLLHWLSRSRLQKVIVLHVNHANEVSASVRDAIQQLRGAGASMLNQSVLLKNVNDSAKTLSDLSEVLFASAVIPYYLHLLDRVSGSAHFEVPLQQAQRIMREVHNQLPGYLVPRLTREEAGKPAKTLVTW